MAFQIPDNLHLDAGPVAWLLGTWRGNGHGNDPQTGPFEFGEELIFTHDGRPFFQYMSRTWLIDPETKAKISEGTVETGFLRCSPGAELGAASLEFVVARNTGILEVSYGLAAEGKVELHTAGVSYTATAPGVEVTAGKRIMGNVEGDLLYANDIEAEGHPMAPYTWARLQRA